MLKGINRYVKIRMVIEQEAILIYILWGEDQFSMEEALQEIKKTAGDASMLATNTNVLDGMKLSLSELKSVGEAMPFLAEKRLLIVKGLLGRFEAKDKSGRTRKSNVSGAKEDETQSLADCIKGFPPSTILVLMDPIENKKNSLQNNIIFNSISSQAKVLSFPMMTGTKLSQWIQSRVDQHSSSISRQAINILIQLIGSDLYTMNNEISKLVSYTAGRMIEEKDVRAVVAAAREEDIFTMVDAIMDWNSGLGEQILQKLLQNGVAPSQILVLLARQVQMLIQFKDLKSQKRPLPEIQGKLGISYGFVWDKISRRAERYTLERLKEIYRSLLKTDLDIKTGRFDGDLALNLLVAELCAKGQK
jgi:DNA polymerase III subunit delta